MRRIILALLVSSAATAGAHADDGWSCSNEELEISCGGGRCSITEDGAFTPTSLTVAPETISYCAYSGCWRGVPFISLTEESFYALGSDLRWNDGSDAAGETIQVAIDTTIGLGVVIGGGFAMPVRCVPWSCGEDCKSSLSKN